LIGSDALLGVVDLLGNLEQFFEAHRLALQGVLTSSMPLTGGRRASEKSVLLPRSPTGLLQPAGLSSLLSGLTVPPACRAPQS
ncbi:hypothetical protein, partial [Pseudomonas aeruginosa]|uniref:hypothetical protein n=1 Tax=Pseudomonas aeruginosa TaxID=287 RepID=UPI001F4B7017